MQSSDNPHMEKSLTVYPIASGDMLNIYAEDPFEGVRIMDMQGNEVYKEEVTPGTKVQVVIDSLPDATYIVEITHPDNKIARSVFVKM